MTTIKDIAKLSGFSIGTVSRVINNHPDVSDETKKKVLEIIARTGFQPNTNARMLKQTVPSSIAVMVKGYGNAFFEIILEEMQKILKENGEEVTVFFLDEQANEIETAVQMCVERKPKGIIFLGGNLKYFMEGFSQLKVPCVLTTQSAADLDLEGLSSFSTDDAEGAMEAVNYLIRRGHKHIGILGGSLSTEYGQISTNRIRGAIRAMGSHDLLFDLEKSYEPCRFSMEEGYEAVKRLLDKDPEITAVFALGDMIAIGAVRGLGDMNKKVPKDVSIIGFDGIGYTKFSVPRIATISQDTKELARRSVEDLLMRISYTRKSTHQLIDFKVISGESVRDIKS